MLEGEHDVYTAPSVTGRIDSCLSEGVPIVVDLSRASFIDSSILEGLDRCAEQLGGEEPWLRRLRDQSEDSYVRRVFEVARAQELFTIVSSQAEAIE